MKYILAILALLIWIPVFAGISGVAKAIEDPLTVANNKFGIHIISPSFEEASESADLVNSSGGDWGYITFVIESNDRKVEKWQQFFDILRRKHLIPIVRLASKPSGDVWEKPTSQDSQDWANFLNQLNWPVKNRYVTIYNEPNHSNEWGGNTDPVSYAQTLNETIDALKSKSPDFFVLNGAMDASTPHEPPRYYDAQKFLIEMDKTVPGIFDKLDGWSSHSYPNPGFVGSPNGTGRGSVKTYTWELNLIRSLGSKKELPVFITETGWKHSDGLSKNSSLPSPDEVAENYKTAFEYAWNDHKIVAVTPFLLNYTQPPFDHFSFKKVTQLDKTQANVLGIKFPNYNKQYQTLADLNKTAGAPKQLNLAQLVKGEVYHSVGLNQEYTINLTFKNTGQSIWNDGGQIKLKAISGGDELNFQETAIPSDKKVEPNQEYTFEFKIKATSGGIKPLTLNLFRNDQKFESPDIQFNTEAKAPVVLLIKSALKWQDDPSGEYTLTIDEVLNKGARKVNVDQAGVSDEVQAYDLPPDYPFTFTLKKPYYKPRTINVQIQSGVNTLDFGTLEPDFTSALLNPKAFWDLLPF